jgi:acyl dehydratase
MKFSDLTVGRRFTLGPISVTDEEVVAFAKEYDDQWFHTDPERAAKGHFGGLIASGWQTCGLAMRLVSQEILKGSESYASPGLNYLRWPNPVRPGDKLTLKLTVLESRVSTSRPWLGIVRWKWAMYNQDGKEVLDMEATSMFKVGESAERVVPAA